MGTWRELLHLVQYNQQHQLSDSKTKRWMAFSMGWRGTTWMGVTVACPVTGEKGCRLLAVNVASPQNDVMGGCI